ncbi:MAG: xanthine dehydrogenase family protein subunit M [Candidatus Bathyarchaeota archaeon]|nr:xanthine dehydrogenase family protein subunit M [Candidatus Bathyarchaeota archaeon]
MRPTPSFQYHAPKTLEGAIELMGTLENVKPIIGGTDLIPQMKEGVFSPDHVVDLNNVAELNYVREDNGLICIGATATHNQIAASDAVKKSQALLDAMTMIGSPQIRNRGTITGNLINASPAADSAPPLLVHDAEVVIRSIDEERIIPLTALFTGPKLNCLEQNELLTEIRFPTPPVNSASAFKRIGRRKAFTLSVVSAAAYVEMEGERCVDARVAFGSVAMTPIRASEVEDMLEDKTLTASIIAEACLAARNHVHPITDVRGTAEYRKDMCEVLLRRALEAALERVR